MSNNNPLTEIGAIILAAVLIIVAGLLVYVGKFSTADAGIAFTLAVGLFAGNLALKAPSPTQQAALLQLTTQALQAQAQPAQLVQAPAPVATPNTAAMMEQAAQYANALSTPGSAISPAAVAMPPAMLTTGVMPAVPKPLTVPYAGSLTQTSTL